MACGDSDDGDDSASRREPEAKQLNFYNWTDYVAEDTIPNFKKQTGIKVTYDNYSSNDELFAKLRQGSTGYDLIVPTDNFVVKMNEGDLLEPLDLGLIPNLKNLDERFRNADYDPGNKYSIPWQWGTTGIGYDPTKVGEEVNDWDALDAPVGPQDEARSSTRHATRSAWRCSRSARIRTAPTRPTRRGPGVPDQPEEEGEADHLRLPGPAQGGRAHHRAGLLR